jgi:hypothetical protein
MTATNWKKARLLLRASAIAGMAVLLGGCPGNLTSNAYNANEKIGLSLAPSAVTIDGIANEAAWSKSSRVFLEDGASVSAAFMRGMEDANNVYLYFEAEDTSFDDFDAVVLAFNPSGASNDFHRLHIYPCMLSGGGVCPGGGSAPGGLNPTVESADGTLSGTDITWGALTTGAAPGGIELKSNVAPNGLANRWSVEVRIPRAAPYAFDPSISTDVGMGTAAQYSWPLGTFIGSSQNDAFGTVQTAPLKPARWGNVTLNTANFPTGLQITGFNNVGQDPSKISLTQANDFTGTVANNPAGAGNEPDFTGVTARFKINNIGLNPSWTWTDIPVGNNPTAPGQTIKAREYMPFSPDEWTLSQSDNWQGSGKSQYQFFTDNDHQCVMVEVSYTGMASPISRFFNMQFVATNSPFDMNPQIATGAWRRNYENARGVMLRELFLNGGREVGYQSQFAGAEPAGEHRWLIRSLDQQSARLKTSILPAETLQLPSQNNRLDAAALSRGKQLDLAVRPGSVLTLLAQGEVGHGEGRFGPHGMSEAAARRNNVQADRIPDALRPGMHARIGELIGSFDGFHTSFAIGSGLTMVVPANAERLSVRFSPGVAYDRGSIDLQAITTPMTPAMLDGAPLQSIREARNGVLLPLGMNLPMYIVRGTLDTGNVVTIHGKQFRAGVPMGSYGAFIRSIRGSGDVRPTAPHPIHVDLTDVAQPVIR